MKKVIYFIVIAAELFIDALLLYSLFQSTLYIPFALAIVGLAAALTWQFILLSKTTDSSARRRIIFRIPLLMLIPAAVFIVSYIIVAVIFSFASFF